MQLFGFSADWQDLEPSPRQFTLQQQLTNPLTLLVPRYHQLKGVVLVLKMIDTNWRPMPADLQDKPFDDPEVLSRFDALIDAIAAEPSSKNITHMLLGNEIDGYLSQHPDQIHGFAVFYQRAVNRIHRKMPDVKVSTILTFNALNPPALLDVFAPASDFITYTYYPINESSIDKGWQMRPIQEIRADIDMMARRAGDKPFAFTEIGYSSSPINGSSEEKQAKFVRAMFQAISGYQRTGRVTFLLYHALYDYPPGVCTPYAEMQGVDPNTICGFMENLGLRRYDTGKPRKSWREFIHGLQRLQ